MADGTDPSTGSDGERPEPSRRAFLIGAAGVGVAVGGVVSAAILLARGGSPVPGGAATGTPSSARPTPTPTPTPSPTPTVTTVPELLSERPFRIAHRGGSDDWPEMSAFAYRQSVAHGYRALEMSVARSADGVWFGSHDATLDRVAGTSGFVAAEHDWAEISTLRISATGTRNPDQPSRPFLRLDDFLAEFAHREVVFLDPKAAASRYYPELLTRIRQGVPDGAHQIVAKSPGSNTAWARLASAAGLRTWGFYYAADVSSGLLARTAPQWDLLGLDVTAPAAVWSSVLGLQKPVIAHVLHTPEDDRRALALGATGEVVADVLAIPA